MPIPLILRELEIRPNLTWDGLIDDFLSHAMSEPLRAGTTLSDVLDRGQGFLMLDGLDEIGDPVVRAGLRRAVYNGMDRYPGCRWLLTSRIVGYEPVAFDQPDGLERECPGSDSELDSEIISGSVAAAGPLARSGLSELQAQAVAQVGLLAQDLLETLSSRTRGYVAPFADAQIERFVHSW